jgi:methylated-DNA-protein-cysteine methyltransferase-like protein
MSNAPDEATVEERIWHVVSQIPRGKVATYGQVAELAGLLRAARKVGRTMSLLPRDSRLPWHRVVNAAGRVSPRGGGEHRQRELLEAEGVVFLKGRIDLAHYRWIP